MKDSYSLQPAVSENCSGHVSCDHVPGRRLWDTRQLSTSFPGKGLLLFLVDG